MCLTFLMMEMGTVHLVNQQDAVRFETNAPEKRSVNERTLSAHESGQRHLIIIYIQPT